MEKKRLLLLTQDMDPYTLASQIATIGRELPLHMHDSGMELRILMPRFGTINERRHRLHEVVRLSGMNIVVNDEDFPLIIKVASMPGSRLQVYFLDNDEFFKRKHVFEDENGVAFEDNMDRMIFFCKGAIETVKKFGWPPDIIHCHGWMTGLVPMFLRTLYKDQPLFRNSRVTWTAYNHGASGQFKPEDFDKAFVPPMTKKAFDPFFTDTGVSLDAGVYHYADAFVKIEPTLSAEMEEALATGNKPLLTSSDEPNYLEEYVEFFDTIIGQTV